MRIPGDGDGFLISGNHSCYAVIGMMENITVRKMVITLTTVARVDLSICSPCFSLANKREPIMDRSTTNSASNQLMKMCCQ